MADRPHFEWRRMAYDEWAEGGMADDLIIDEDYAEVSAAEDDAGAWVQAWVWVDAPDEEDETTDAAPVYSLPSLWPDELPPQPPMFNAAALTEAWWKPKPQVLPSHRPKPHMKLKVWWKPKAQVIPKVGQ